MEPVQIQCQSQAGKCTVTGIGKGFHKILAAVGLTVEAFNGLIPIVINTITVKMKILVIIWMFPHIFKGCYDLKCGSRGV